MAGVEWGPAVRFRLSMPWAGTVPSYSPNPLSRPVGASNPRVLRAVLPCSTAARTTPWTQGSLAASAPAVEAPPWPPFSGFSRRDNPLGPQTRNLDYAEPRDRKSVVEGKRVAVRVGLGGCLRIKQKLNIYTPTRT